MKVNRKATHIHLDRACLLLAVLVLIGTLGLSLNSLLELEPAADEMIFIRVTQQLPKYSTHAEWWSLMGKTHPADAMGLPEVREVYDHNYELPIRLHPPVANYLVYPFVKALYSEETPEQVYESVEDLRWIAWFVIALCIAAVVYIAWRKNKSGLVLLLSILPLVAIIPLLSVFGNNWFYNDTFMLLFLVIALVMRKTEYEKFIYIPLALMVGCKMYAFLFLIPFIIENRKTALCGLMLVPYFAQCYVVTGDFLFPFTQRVGLEDFREIGIVSATMGLLWAEIMKIPYFIGIVVMPFTYLVSKWNENKNWFLPLLFIISLGVTGLGTTACLYRLLPAMIVGTLVIGEAVSQWISSSRIGKEIVPA